jgi:lysophospholipase L1-like esterase
MDAEAKYNESLRPENRDALIALAEMFNERLKSVEALSDGDVRVQFSDAFMHVPSSDPALYSLEDAEHPNRAGHELFARTAYRYLTETLASRDAERSMAQAEGRANDVMSGNFGP